jgi:hypothetical protein
MKRTTRIARIAGWLLAACAACCCPPAPCHAGPGDCEASVAAMPCGSGSAPAVPTVAKRAPEPPVLQAVLPIASQPVVAGGGLPGPARAGDPGVRTSALRLSVVRRL